MPGDLPFVAHLVVGLQRAGSAGHRLLFTVGKRRVRAACQLSLTPPLAEVAKAGDVAVRDARNSTRCSDVCCIRVSPLGNPAAVTPSG